MSSNEYEIIETLILNLGVIGEITEGKKLNTKEKYLSLYETYFWQGAMRWFYGDSRASVATKIKSIHNSSSEIINKAIKDLKENKNEVKGRYLDMDPKTFLDTMRTKLIKANKGLGHLRDTYLYDIIFTEQIQIHINAISRQIKTIDNILGNKEIEIK